MPRGTFNGKRWCMYPNSHNEVLQRLNSHGLTPDFHHVDDEVGCIQSYDTNIMGRFLCNNSNCDVQGWSSKQIAITIRMYSGMKYNARVYYQRCRGCKRLSRPHMDHSYAERVTYRIKKWSGIEVEVPPYTAQSNGPHETRLCEGCKHGHCSQR
ncbi:zinc-binding domain-containing protein [Truncatella angustata]|uniref:Zinc-binding domain-containing protein n=1 Tax=Truncatella angustata TaxID=152316 RepID=A0A9P8UJG2_9PEZI|nr:zinc-binding domain-containing protein [Truncatella angustata]KAH6653291.1 zinc-binding domain-containing protein [Truncatella angustata]